MEPAPTRQGTLECSLEWRQNRATLSWELQPHDLGAAVLLTAPGLDPVWMGTR